MAEDRYHVYYEGWTADCEVPIFPEYFCGYQVAGRTKAEVVRLIRQHIKEAHPRVRVIEDGGEG